MCIVETNLCNKSWLALYKLLSCFNSCLNATRHDTSVIKVDGACMGVYILRHFKEELAWAIDQQPQVISVIIRA